MMFNINNDFLKNNKIIITIAVIVLVGIVLSSFLGGNNKNIANNKKNHSDQSSYIESATGDDTAESLDALTQQLHAVVKSNHALQVSNAQLNKKNAHILENLREEVQQNIDAELKRRGQDNQTKITSLEKSLATINQSLSKIKNSQLKHTVRYGYQVDGANSINHVSSQIVLADRGLTEIADIAPQHHHSNSTSSLADNDSLLHPVNLKNTAYKASNSMPYYTVPSGATLTNAVTMTSLIGRVPVDGVVKSPYPFKIIIGGNNLAANGLHIPGLSGAIVQGVTVGDMALRCVKGYVTAITFIFPDGRISTTQLSSSGDGGDLGFNHALGYLSQPNGNPCFPGKFYTNAPQYLTTMIALGALNQGGQAYSQAQTTAMTNAVGGTTTSLTGSLGKYMLGGAVSGGTSQAMHWFTQREKNSFDAVYVRAGRKAVINITKQISINYNARGRKIYYVHHKKKHNNTSLD